MEIEAGNPLGKASGEETRRIRESSVSKKRKGEDLTKEDAIIEAKEEDMERSGCNDEYGSSNEEWQIPNYHKQKFQRGSRPSRRQQRQDGPRYTVIIKPTAAVNITNTDSWLLWSTFRKILSSPCENDQIGYAVSNGNNSIAVTVRTEQHAQDLMALKELPTEDPDKKIEVTVYRSTTGSQPRGVIHGVSPGDAARGIVENAIADYHDIIHARPIGKNGTYLITFEGQGIPRSLRLFGRYHNVFPYKPTAVVCLQCHGLGHKATVCTRKQRCKTCGEVHPNNQPCQAKYSPTARKLATRFSKSKRVKPGTERTTNSRRERRTVDATMAAARCPPLQKKAGPPTGLHITRTTSPPSHRRSSNRLNSESQNRLTDKH